MAHTNTGDKYMDINEMFMLIGKCFLSVIILFIVTKITGKKQVSQLSLFDYVIGISIGNFIAEMVLNAEVKFSDGILAMFVFGLISYIVSYISMKSIMLRRFIIGVPTVIVEDGKIIESGLVKTNIDINDFLEQCRLQGYFNVDDISYAIMEASGDISILPKSKATPVTRSDMKIRGQKEILTANLIIDGKFLNQNIKGCNLTINKVKDELRKMGYQDESNILLAVYSNKQILFYEKDVDTKNHSLLE